MNISNRLVELTRKLALGVEMVKGIGMKGITDQSAMILIPSMINLFSLTKKNASRFCMELAPLMLVDN